MTYAGLTRSLYHPSQWLTRRSRISEINGFGFSNIVVLAHEDHCLPVRVAGEFDLPFTHRPGNADAPSRDCRHGGGRKVGDVKE